MIPSLRKKPCPLLWTGLLPRVLSGEWSIEMTSQDAPSIESAKLVTEFFALFDERGSLLFKGGET